MKKSPLLNLLIVSALLAGNSFANTEKMTYEKAMESDKKTFHNNSVPLQETIDNWNTYVKPPNTSSGGSGKMQEVWSGKSTSVKNEWGEGAFFIELQDPYNSKETVANLWLNVSGNYSKKNSATPSGYGYEKSWFVVYENGKFNAKGIRESAPYITSIAKQEIAIKMYNDCTPGQSEGTQNYSCPNPSVEKLCEEGYKTRTCASNGLWNAWESKPPLCVRRDRECP